MLIFLHIPKTAGTTLNSILGRQFRTNGAIYHQDVWDPDCAARAFLQLPLKRQSAVRLFRGHFHFGVHERLSQPSKYFTLLRDPIERVISHYYYVLGTPSHLEHPYVMSRKMTLQDYITSGVYPEMDNGQTRMLAGKSGLHDATGFGQCGESLLMQAQENLAHSFGVVGTMENFDASLLLLQRLYNWKTPLYVRENVTRGRPRQRDISPTTLATIAEYNHLDIALYDFVAQRFEEHVKSQGSAFSAALVRFQSANARHNQVNHMVKTALAPVRRTMRPLKRALFAAVGDGNLEALDKPAAKPVY